jgi:DNA-binding PadR family transcriptional regulator
MIVAYAILAALRDGPKHGYAIRGWIQEMLGLLWPVNQGQLYSTISALARRGWIAEVASADHPGGAGAGRSYELRAAGERRLAEWTGRPTAVTAVRGELESKLHIAAGLADPGRLLRVVRRQREACAAFAATCRSHAESKGAGTGATAAPGSLARAAAPSFVDADGDWLASIECELLGVAGSSDRPSSNGPSMTTAARTNGEA